MEKGLCDYSEFKFSRIAFDAVDHLGEDQLVGQALALTPSNEDPHAMLQSSFYMKKRSKVMSMLKFLPDLQTETRKTLKRIAKKVVHTLEQMSD